MIYMVEHGFAGDPAKETAWNEWYSDHATNAFRRVPGWRTGQRFVALPPSQPKYRAMYTLDNAEVLNSPEYKATTGGRFPEAWRSMIVGFHRDLMDGDRMPAVPMQDALVVVDPPGADAQLPGVELRWWNVVGLERTVERRAIGVVDRATGEAIARRQLPGVAVYAPVFERWQV
jgi:hypothetical protein